MSNNSPFEKTNGMEHSVSNRAKKVVVAKLSDGEEIMLTAEHIPGTIPPQYALKVTAETIIDGDVYIDGITVCSNDSGAHQYFILSDSSGRPKINVDQLNGATINLGTGTISTGTQRFTLASDDLLVTNSTAIKNAVEIMDDWDESDRAKVNPIVGQAGISAGSAAIGVTTPSVTLATNDPAVTALQIVDDWDESDRAKVNPIVGQAGISAGSATIGVTTPSVTLATNDPAVTAVQIMDDWDESDRAKVNPIVGQAGIAAGTGVDGVTVPRVSLATNVALPAGTNLLGKVGIDQTTPGTTDKVSLISGQNGIAGGTGVTGATVPRVTLATDVALPAGTNLLGKVGIDQTTPGTTDKVSLISGQNGIAGGTGVTGANVPRVSLATDVALPAGTNLMGKVGIDQTTPGTTDKVSLISGQNAILGNVGVSAANTPRVSLARDANGLFLPSNYVSIIDGTVAYTSNITVTCSGFPFTVDDANCFIEYIQIKPTGGVWGAPFMNGRDGISLSATTNVITIVGAGTPFALSDTYRLGIRYQEKAYSQADDSIRTAEINPLSLQVVEESLVDTTAVAASQQWYPSSTGMAILGYKNLSLTGKYIEDTAGITSTITCWASNDEDTAAGDWIQIYGYDSKNNVYVNQMQQVGIGTLTFSWDFDNINYRYVRIGVLPGDASNTVIIKCRRSY